MISYNAFLCLTSSAKDCGDVDEFVSASVGKVHEANVRIVVKALELIWNISRDPSVGLLRKLTGMSQVEFCNHFQMSVSSLSKWETGVVGIPAYSLPLLAYAVFSCLLDPEA